MIDYIYLKNEKKLFRYKILIFLKMIKINFKLNFLIIVKLSLYLINLYLLK